MSAQVGQATERELIFFLRILALTAIFLLSGTENMEALQSMAFLNS